MTHGITPRDHLVSGRSIRPWHGLGTTVGGTLTPLEALRAAKLDWRVSLETLTFTNPRYAYVPVPARAVVRTDTQDLLGVVGERYVPVQNEDLVAVLDAILDFGARLDTAGSLLGGRYVWFSALLAEFHAAGDLHQEYLVVSHAHDGSRAVTVRRTTVRVVCWNTLQAHDRRSSLGFSVRHTASAKERIAAIGRLLREADPDRQHFRDTAHRLSRARVSERDQVRYLLQSLGLDPELELRSVKRKIEAAKAALAWEREHAHSDPDTAWTMLQGVTHYLAHETASKGSRTPKGRERRLVSVLDGERARTARKAYRRAIDELTTARTAISI